MPFRIVRNDLTQMKVDAIVNSANPKVGYGAGTDAAVYNAAGMDELLAARQEIGDINPGEAYITPGFNLHASYIIHTVGPIWEGGGAGEREILRACYKSALQIACEHKLESIAFPLISSGNYGFPKNEALNVPLSVFSEFLADNDMDIYLVVYDRESVRVSEGLFTDIDSFIDDNYVELNIPREASMSRQMPMPSYHAATPAQEQVSKRRPSLFRRDRAVRRHDADELREANVAEITPEASALYMCEDIDFASEAPIIHNARSLDDVIGNLQKTFMELVFSFADEKGLTDLEVRKRANLDKKTFSKLKCGNTKNPSKATALAIAIALELNLDETKDLLARAGMALSPCSRFDLIVQYFIERSIYDIYTINVALFEHDEQLLGSQAID